MEVRSIVQILSDQIESLSGGFEVLANVNTLKEMASQFGHILRSRLLMSDINIFYKNIRYPHWQELLIESGQSVDFLNHHEMPAEFQIQFFEGSEYKIRISLPLSQTDRFALLIGARTDGKQCSDSDRLSLQIYLQMLSSAYQIFQGRQKEKELIFSLNHKILQLNSLVETGIELSKFEKERQLFKLALERAISLTNAAGGQVSFEVDGAAGRKMYFPKKFRIRPGDGCITAGFNFKKSRYTITLANKESRSGFVPFDETDQLLLNSLSRQVNGILENNDLHRQALEKQRIEQEISVAASIQRAILPKNLPEIPGYDLYGINIPSKDIGGDYYDCVRLQDGRYALIIADVAGKGISAALLVSSLHASLRAYLPNISSLSQLANQLNQAIYDASTPDKYITFFMAILNPETGDLESLNAGHNPIFIVKPDQTVISLEAGGIPLGMMGMALPFPEKHYTLEKGDRVLFYTDGVTEAANKKAVFYEDEDRFNTFVRTHSHQPSRIFIESLVSDIKNFCGNVPQGDDITVMYLSRKLY